MVPCDSIHNSQVFFIFLHTLSSSVIKTISSRVDNPENLLDSIGILIFISGSLVIDTFLPTVPIELVAVIVNNSTQNLLCSLEYTEIAASTPESAAVNS